MLKPEKLAKFDAFCFDQYTGGLSEDEKSGRPCWRSSGEARVWRACTPPPIPRLEVPEYGEMIGGYFAGHPFRHISVNSTTRRARSRDV